MKNIVVLGCGLVGRVMAEDLSQNHNVTSVDISQDNLDKIRSKKVDKICKDVSDSKILNDIIKDFDLVVGALPGFMGHETMKRVIMAKKNIVDISFYPEDPFTLDKLAKENNVVAVMDCGVAPGMGNIIFSHHDKSMEITDYECLVGGLPKKREWPFEYQAVFSPIDVIEEYIRPARYVQNKALIIKEAPTSFAHSISKFLKGCTTISAFNSFKQAISVSISCTLSSNEKRGFLSLFIATPITNLSTNNEALLIMSICPSVKGSKVPGYNPTRILAIPSLLSSQFNNSQTIGLKNSPVKLSLIVLIYSGVPWQTTSPPLSPPSGPISIT